MSIQNYSLEEAAKILRCRLSYLKDNLSRLPHQKIGVAVAFDDDELLVPRAEPGFRHSGDAGRKRLRRGRGQRRGCRR